jgi:PleD family two-component response regulator
MSEGPARSTPAFVALARRQVRTTLELATKRSPENATRIAAELTALSTEASALGLVSIVELARRGSEQARLLDRDHTAVAASARTLRDLGRAIEALEKAAQSEQAVASAARGPGRVLIIDDSVLNAAVVCDALEHAAFAAQHAEDLDTAVTVVARFAPDIVLADVHMPDCTPDVLCARVRSAAGTRSVHVLLFSGIPDEALAQLARESLADGFVSKERGLAAVVAEVTSVYQRRPK